MDNRSKLEKIIEYRKAKGSTRKPKYATRKLSIGLVSCLLGFTLLVSPTDSFASEQAGTEVSEGTAEGQPTENKETKNDAADNQTSEINSGEAEN